MPLVYVILSILLSFWVFSILKAFWKKREHSRSLGLNGQEFGKARKKIKGNGVCEGDQAQETCDRAHQRSSVQEED
jgi:hypothetical protein